MYLHIRPSTQVERDLERSKKELKKELDHAHIIREQDRAHRERFELCKKKLRDVVDAVETLHNMAADLEDSTAHMKVPIFLLLWLKALCHMLAHTLHLITCVELPSKYCAAWARSKRRSFSPGAAARHRGRTRVPPDLYTLFFLALILASTFALYFFSVFEIGHLVVEIGLHFGCNIYLNSTFKKTRLHLGSMYIQSLHTYMFRAVCALCAVDSYWNAN